MLLVNTSHVMNSLLYRTRVPFDLFEDFEYVTQLVKVPIALVVHPDFPVNNIQELIGLSKTSEAPLQYGSAGLGSAQALTMELLRHTASMPEMTHVPYKGAGPALVDLLAGRIPMMFSTAVSSMPYLKGGRLRAIALADTERTELLPGVPTIAETLPDFQMETSWMGIIVAGGTPDPVVEQINVAITDALKSPKVDKWVRDQGLLPVGSSHASFQALIQKEYDLWSDLVERLDLKLE